MIARLVALALFAVVLLFGGVMVVSELGTEVVVLHTTDERGADHSTSLWIVEDEGELWLRAGQPGSGWLTRLRTNPEVELERGDQRLRLNAVAVPEQRERVHRLMRERYGWAETVIATMRDGSESVPVRLDSR